MWDITGGFIQVEIGKNVVKEYTRKQGVLDALFGSNTAFQQGQLLVECCAALREELAKQGVDLPFVTFRDSSELGDSQFKIYVGIECLVGDTNQHDLIGTLRNMVLRQQRPGMSAQSVLDELVRGAELLRNNSFNKAVESFISVYYWASMLGCVEELVNATLNLGVVNLRNNRLGDALLCAQRACVLTEEGGFYDPYLKFNSHNFLANMYWLTEQPALAVENYAKAVEDVRFLEDVPLRIFALWNANSAYFITGNYDACSEALDGIYMMIANDESYPKQMVEQLYEYKAAVYQKQTNLALPARESLAPKFSPDKLADGVMAFATSHRGMQLISLVGVFIGSVLRGFLAKAVSGQINYKSNNTVSFKIGSFNS